MFHFIWRIADHNATRILNNKALHTWNAYGLLHYIKYLTASTTIQIYEAKHSIACAFQFTATYVLYLKWLPSHLQVQKRHHKSFVCFEANTIDIWKLAINHNQIPWSVIGCKNIKRRIGREKVWAFVLINFQMAGNIMGSITLLKWLTHKPLYSGSGKHEHATSPL